MEKVIKKLQDEIKYQEHLKLSEKFRRQKIASGTKVGSGFGLHDPDYVRQLKQAVSLLNSGNTERVTNPAASHG